MYYLHMSHISHNPKRDDDTKQQEPPPLYTITDNVLLGFEARAMPLPPRRATPPRPPTQCEEFDRINNKTAGEVLD